MHESKSAFEKKKKKKNAIIGVLVFACTIKEILFLHACCVSLLRYRGNHHFLANLRFGINIPQFVPSSDRSVLTRLSKFAEAAESLGYDCLWTLDGIFHGVLFLEPLTCLGYLSSVTRKIKLGTAVLLLPLRVPAIVANETAAIDFLSGGRLVLGVAMGGQKKEYAACGVPMSERVPRFVEGIQILKMLWSQDRVTFRGRFWNFDNVGIALKPANPQGIPLLMGGSMVGDEVNERALTRAAEMSDGWLGAGSTTLEASKRSFSRFIEYAREKGRDPERLDVVKRVYVHVDSDEKRARSILEESLYGFYGARIDVDSVCVFGSPERCAAELTDLARSGAKNFLLNPVAHHFEQTQALAEKVIPKVSLS